MLVFTKPLLFTPPMKAWREHSQLSRFVTGGLPLPVEVNDRLGNFHWRILVPPIKDSVDEILTLHELASIPRSRQAQSARYRAEFLVRTP